MRVGDRERVAGVQHRAVEQVAVVGDLGMSGWITAWSPPPTTSTVAPPTVNVSPGSRTVCAISRSRSCAAVPVSTTSSAPGFCASRAGSFSRSRWSKCWWVTGRVEALEGLVARGEGAGVEQDAGRAGVRDDAGVAEVHEFHAIAVPPDGAPVTWRAWPA